MKLALGTAQFGMAYGTFNSGGRVPPAEVIGILDRAASAGIDTLDTARAYGGAETVLGELRACQRFGIVTKCPSLARARDAAEAMQATFEASCRALATRHVSGFLLHDGHDLCGPNRDTIWASLESLRQSGRVQRIGVSAYDIEEAQKLCSLFPLTLVQLPANVLVPWYETATLPETVEVHVRSAFLQGFLLSDPGTLPEKFEPWRETLETFRWRAHALGLSPLQAALAPLMGSRTIDRIIVGVDNLVQLDDILAAIEYLKTTGYVSLGAFSEVTPELTDPREW